MSAAARVALIALIALIACDRPSGGTAPTEERTAGAEAGSTDETPPVHETPPPTEAGERGPIPVEPAAVVAGEEVEAMGEAGGEPVLSTDASGAFVWPADGRVNPDNALPAVLEVEGPFAARRVAVMWTAPGEPAPEIGIGGAWTPLEVTFREGAAHVARAVWAAPTARVALRGLGEVESIRVELLRDAAGAPGEE